MKCLCCSQRNMKRWRKVGFYQKPGLPVCNTCDALPDDKLLAKKTRRERRSEVV